MERHGRVVAEAYSLDADAAFSVCLTLRYITETEAQSRCKPNPQATLKLNSKAIPRWDQTIVLCLPCAALDSVSHLVVGEPLR